MSVKRQPVLGALPLAPSLAERLARADYMALEDVLDAPVEELKADLGCASVQEAAEVKRAVEVLARGAYEEGHEGESGAVSLQKMERRRKKGPGATRVRSIVTFCEGVDKLLGGGVPLGEITEFCGPPGVGKTQFGMQLAIDVQIPTKMGGVNGQALYIDTEGSLSMERLAQMADALCNHLARMGRRNESLKEIAKSVSRHSIMSNITVMRVHDYAEQIAVVRLLPSFLESNPRILLIVIDSLAFHFRHAFQDMAHRSRVISDSLQRINQLVHNYDVAVVLMNQVTIQFSQAPEGTPVLPSRLVPALGEALAHAATHRLFLYWEGKRHYATLLKSQRLAGAEPAEYAVRDVGIRSVRPAEHSSRKRPLPISHK